MRLLASVHSLMHRKSGPLDELLSTVGVVADVWTDPTVDSLVPSKITASGKGLAARTARIGFWRLCRIVRGPVDDSMRKSGWHTGETHG